VSAFIREDIDILNLRQEYDTVERVVLEAAEQFPENRSNNRHNDMEYALRELVYGSVPPNRSV
jgi:hypothetical protein